MFVVIQVGEPDDVKPVVPENFNRCGSYKAPQEVTTPAPSVAVSTVNAGVQFALLLLLMALAYIN